MPPVAIIDIGSNSIKVLVAGRDPAGGLKVLKLRTLDARISAGISAAEPRLGAEGMTRGLEAIRTLLADAAAYHPARIVLVATSAVRDAANGPEFREQVRAATGQAIRILTGDEEAALIGRGLTSDPALAAMQDFYVFDLGGGSMECLAFQHRQPRQSVSLPLGCVRLTEKFVTDVAAPFPADVATAIQRHTRELLARAKFRFTLPVGTAAIATGGTMTVSRDILARRAATTLDASPPQVSVDQLRELLGSLGALPLAKRKQVPGLPPARADVMPTALATLIAVAEAGGFTSFRHSFYNLRYGLAAEALAAM